MIILFFLMLISLSQAEFKAECYNKSYNESELKPTFISLNNEVKGRYQVQWCTQADNRVTTWVLGLYYYNHRRHKDCEIYDITTTLGNVHSKYEKQIEMNLNCSYVCFTTQLDLIFSDTCYHLQTQLKRGGTSSRPYDELFYVGNMSYSKDQISKSKIGWLPGSNNDMMLFVSLYLGNLPATDYKVELTLQNCTMNKDCLYDLTPNCQAKSASMIHCNKIVPFGKYEGRVEFLAPWTSAELFVNITHFHFIFDHKKQQSDEARVGAGTSAWWWAAASALVLAAALLGALGLVLLSRRHRENKLLHHWLGRATCQLEETQPDEMEGAGPILLLYARDCPHVMRVADELRAVLRRGAPHALVYDVFTPETWRAMAPAAGTWMRQAVTEQRVRVVLLQTPAARELCAAGWRAAPEPGVQGPLLGRAVLYREPHCADPLLPLALRTLHETRAAFPYRKYYKCTIAGMETELAPSVTPLRHYSLPGDTLALLRDLQPAPGRPPAPPAPELLAAVDRLARAADELLAYVRENPDYLNDQLLFI